MDVDGTLIDAAETIHPQDVALLKAFPKTIQPVLTTGRSLSGAKAVLRQNGLFTETTLPLPGVYMNGGAAYLPGETLCDQHSFSPQTHQSLLDLAGAYPSAAFSFFSLRKVFLVNANDFARHISRIHYLEAEEIDAGGLCEEIIKLMVLDQEQAILAEIKAEIEGWAVESAFSLPYALEVNPPGINKAGSLKTLLAALHLEGLPVYALGDGENDLPLFRLSQRSFAPSTAHPAILGAADQVIEREQDGLLGPVLDMISGVS